jgi:FtsH-binding integral membrane protein
MSSEIWNRVAVRVHAMGKRAFIALITVWVLAGFGLTWVGSLITYGVNPGWFSGTVLLLLPFGGIALTSVRSLPVRILGFVWVTVSMGMALGPGLGQYSHSNIEHVLGTTAILSVLYAGIGIIYPKSLESWFSYLFGALLLLIVLQFSTLFLGMVGMPVAVAFTWVERMSIVLFSAFVVYDFNRAMRIERSFINSLDVGIAVYLDILNLFLAFLSQKRDD